MWGFKVPVDRNLPLLLVRITSINVLDVGVTQVGSLTRHSRLKMSHKSSRSLPSLPFLSGWTVRENANFGRRFYCFARKSEKINARKYELSKKLDSRFHRSMSETFKASLSNIPWARVGNFWQRESIKSLSFWKGLRRSRRHFDRHRM